MSPLVLADGAPPAIRTEHLVVSLGGDEFAIRLERVTEILRPPPITEVPGAPSAVFGIASARGRLLTVIDVRRHLGLASSMLGARSRILIVDGDDPIGLLVDHVREVLRIDDAKVEPATVLGPSLHSAIVGIARPEGAENVGRVVVLLDASELAKAGH